MQPRPATARTDIETLDELVGRLARHDAVDGVLLLGSTGTAAMTPTSDYDLLVVLTELPAPLRMVTTWVGGRLTEVYATTAAALDRVVARSAAWSSASEEGTVLFWLQTGRVAYDRAGRLGHVRDQARRAPPPASHERAAYDAWQHLGYDVAQMGRYLASADPVAQIAVDLRLLYGLSDVMVAYFTVRGIPWRGEKAAIRYWQDQDSAFLDRFRACLAEPDRGAKVACYGELVHRALAPMGGPWPVGTTTVAPGAGYGTGEAPPTGTVEGALGFWRDLVGDRTG